MLARQQRKLDDYPNKEGQRDSAQEQTHSKVGFTLFAAHIYFPNVTMTFNYLTVGGVSQV